MTDMTILENIKKIKSRLEPEARRILR